MIYEQALEIAEKTKALLAPHCERIEIAGSIRRLKPFVKDIEIVAIPKPYEIFSGIMILKPDYRYNVIHTDSEWKTATLVLGLSDTGTGTSLYETDGQEFNYTTNSSFIETDGTLSFSSMNDNPRTYITTIGLYNDNNELLAVAKLSRPLLKDFTKELLVRVKLDF